MSLHSSNELTRWPFKIYTGIDINIIIIIIIIIITIIIIIVLLLLLV